MTYLSKKERTRPPNRRAVELISFVHADRRWTLTAGCCEVGRIAKLFIDGAIVDVVSAIAQDAVIIASLALRHGCSLKTFSYAVTGRLDTPAAVARARVKEESGR